MQGILLGISIYLFFVGILIFILIKFQNSRKYLLDVSIFIALLGVLIFALVVPVYPGVGVWGSKKITWLYQFRAIMGGFSNMLIAIGVTGQIIALFIKYRTSQ